MAGIWATPGSAWQRPLVGCAGLVMGLGGTLVQGSDCMLRSDGGIRWASPSYGVAATKASGVRHWPLGTPLVL
eukprot:5590672-Amphidinium_carterae.1